MDRPDALAASPLLEGFTEVGLRILAGASAARTVFPGTYAFRAGEPSNALSFVVKGRLQLLARDGGAAIGELAAGDTAGGLALLSGPGEHLVSAMAVGEVELLELSRDAFEELRKARPRTCLKLTLALAADLADRLREAKGPLREFLVWQISKRQSEGR